MSASLVLLDEQNADGSSVVTLSPLDSTYNVYMLIFQNVVPSTDNTQLVMRFRNSSGDVSSSNYDFAHRVLKTYSDPDDDSDTGETGFDLTDQELGTGTGEVGYGIVYLFNTQNSSEYSFYTIEATCIDDNGYLFGNQGGGVLRVAEQHTGVSFLDNTGGNMASGNFKLYGIVK
jgi:hypothetical protein